MANDDGSPRPRPGRRCCGTLARVDLVTFLIAATLCSASYCLGMWHNSRGAADSRVLAPSAAVAAGGTYCGGDADEPFDFEAHHDAEGAGLSVSTRAAKATGTRRVLRGVAWAAEAGAGKRWARVDGGSLRFTDAAASVHA